MKGYVVCVYKNITNEEKLKEYAVKAKIAVEKYKGKFLIRGGKAIANEGESCLLYTSPSPRDLSTSRMPSSA